MAKPSPAKKRIAAGLAPFSKMDIDFIDIRLFVNIAETNSLTRGAERTHMSLPAASIRIKNTEERLRTKLFRRTSHGVTLTAAGQAFLHHGKLLLRQLEDLRSDLHEYAEGIRGHVRLLSNTVSIAEFLPSVLNAFLVCHPDVNIELHERTSAQIVRLISEGAADIGIIAGGVQTLGLEVLPYREDRLVLATPMEHPLAQHEQVSFATTLDFAQVSLGEGASLNTFLREAANVVNKPLKIRITAGNFEALCRMIQSGVGIGVLSESAARRHANTMNIRIIRLSDEWAVRRLFICVRRLQSLPPLARQLVDLLSADAAGAVPAALRTPTAQAKKS